MTSLVGELSELMGIRTSQQSDGRLFVSTTDGVQLISDSYAELVHQPTFGPSFSPITVQTIHPRDRCRDRDAPHIRSARDIR